MDRWMDRQQRGGESASLQAPDASGGRGGGGGDVITRSRLVGWLSYQRDLQRRGRLRGDRMAKLSEAGMVWSVRDEQWQSKLDQVRNIISAFSAPPTPATPAVPAPAAGGPPTPASAGSMEDTRRGGGWGGRDAGSVGEGLPEGSDGVHSGVPSALGCTSQGTCTCSLGLTT